MLKDLLYVSEGTKTLFSILRDKNTSEKERIATSLIFLFPRKFV